MYELLEAEGVVTRELRNKVRALGLDRLTDEHPGHVPSPSAMGG